MSHVPISLDSLDVRRAVRSVLPLVLAGVVLAALGGCDAVDLQSDPGDRAAPSAAAQIDADPFDQANLVFEPVSLSPGKTFSIELVDDQFDQGVTRITHEGTSDGGHRLVARFAPLQPASVTVRCRNVQEGTQRTMATYSSDQLGSTAGIPVANAEDEPTSYHYTEGEDNTVVSVDYDLRTTNWGPEPKATTQFSGQKQAAACTHIDFVLKGMSTSLSPDGVQFSGDVGIPDIRKQEFH